MMSYDVMSSSSDDFLVGYKVEVWDFVVFLRFLRVYKEELSPRCSHLSDKIYKYCSHYF